MTMRRPRAWGDSNISAVVTSGGSLKVDLLTNLAASDTVTVTRLIGHLTVIPGTSLSVVDGAMAIDIGIGVSALEAFTAGVLPDPDQEQDQPARGWLYATRLLFFRAVGAGPVDTWHYPELHFDVRAARKVDRGVLYLFVKSGAALGSSQDVFISGRVRALCLT